MEARRGLVLKFCWASFISSLPTAERWEASKNSHGCYVRLPLVISQRRPAFFAGFLYRGSAFSQVTAARATRDSCPGAGAGAAAAWPYRGCCVRAQDGARGWAALGSPQHYSSQAAPGTAVPPPRVRPDKRAARGRGESARRRSRAGLGWAGPGSSVPSPAPAAGRPAGPRGGHGARPAAGPAGSLSRAGPSRALPRCSAAA